MIRTYQIFLLLSLTLASCASLEPQKLANSNDKEPEWVNSNEVTFIKDNKLYAKGVAEAKQHARSSALFRVSDSNAKRLIFQKIQANNEYQLNGSESGVDGIGSYELNINERSKLSLSNIEVNERYWKVIETFNEDGEEELIKVAYSLVSIDLKTMRKSIKELKNAQ